MDAANLAQAKEAEWRAAKAKQAKLDADKAKAAADQAEAARAERSRAEPGRRAGAEARAAEARAAQAEAEAAAFSDNTVTEHHFQINCQLSPDAHNCHLISELLPHAKQGNGHFATAHKYAARSVAMV